MHENLNGEQVLLYGANYGSMTIGGSSKGATGTTKEIVNIALSSLAEQGVNATPISNGIYWSSNMSSIASIWTVNMNTGYRSSETRSHPYYVRPSLEF